MNPWNELFFLELADLQNPETIQYTSSYLVAGESESIKVVVFSCRCASTASNTVDPIWPRVWNEADRKAWYTH